MHQKGGSRLVLRRLSNALVSQETCFGPLEHLESSMNVGSIFKQFSEHSLRLVAEHQHTSGAFPACPNFEPFRYGFLRDGAFCAYAQLIAGNEGSCRAFLERGAAAIKPLSDRVADIAKKSGAANQFWTMNFFQPDSLWKVRLKEPNGRISKLIVMALSCGF